MPWHLPLAYTYIPMSFESSLACLSCLAQHNCYVMSCTWLDHSAWGILIRLSVHIQYGHFLQFPWNCFWWIYEFETALWWFFAFFEGGNFLEVLIYKLKLSEAPSTLKGPWTAWPWLTRTLWLWGGGMLWVTSQGPLGLFLVSFNSYWLSTSVSDLISSVKTPGIYHPAKLDSSNLNNVIIFFETGFHLTGWPWSCYLIPPCLPLKY